MQLRELFSEAGLEVVVLHRGLCYNIARRKEFSFSLSQDDLQSQVFVPGFAIADFIHGYVHREVVQAW